MQDLTPFFVLGDGDRINAVLAAVGFNFHLLLRWFAALLRALVTMLSHPTANAEPV